ncbi:MAG TPA: hypothetical protein VK508_19465 [Cyclobacteriaceae bacterium]|nr:hypothetical protein [Cyclobacteriaceae bacterium]
MKSDKNDKTKPDQNKPSVYTPEPPQIMNPSEQSKKSADENKASKSKKNAKKKKS